MQKKEYSPINVKLHDVRKHHKKEQYEIQEMSQQTRSQN